MKSNSRRVIAFILLVCILVIGGCSTGANKSQAPDLTNPTAVAEAAVRKQLGWKKFQMDSPQQSGENWSVMVWRLPKTPGAHVLVEISKEGKVLSMQPGA